MNDNLKAGGEPLVVDGLPAFRDNRIWCIRRGDEAVIVDPGDARVAARHLAANTLRPVAVLLTHHHDDHVGGVEELAARWPGLPVFGPGAESITGVSNPLQGGETLTLLGAAWRVLAVPGHTRGHLAYLLDQSNGLPWRVFSGDVLFGLGCGRLFEGTAAQMAASLAALAALPDDTLIHCAHEYTALNLPFAEAVLPGNEALRRRAATIRQGVAAGQSTLPLRLAEEKATNPFLRCDDAVVLAALQAHLDAPADAHAAAGPVAVFAALREWRNQF